MDHFSGELKFENRRPALMFTLVQSNGKNMYGESFEQHLQFPSIRTDTVTPIAGTCTRLEQDMTFAISILDNVGPAYLYYYHYSYILKEVTFHLFLESIRQIVLEFLCSLFFRCVRSFLSFIRAKV